MSNKKKHTEENEPNYEFDDGREAVCNEQMRELLRKTLDLKEASERGEDNCVEEATSIIEQADEVVNRARGSSTVFLDAQILHTSSLIYKNYVEKVESRLSEFTAKDYAENILTYLNADDGRQNIWEKLGDEASLAFSNTGGWTWQLGALDLDEAMRIPDKPKRRKAEASDVGPVKNPKQVQSGDKEGEDLERHFNVIKKILRDWEATHKEPLQFWDFVLNPRSFSETVENIFHVSHLVKEGVIHLSLDRDGLPTVKIVKKIENSAYWDKNKIPIAVTIDMEQWTELVKAYDIGRPMIPSRYPERS